MPSPALQRWETESQEAFDELENAHRNVGGKERGRRWATKQINRSYVVLLAAEFQAYCRDLHSAASAFIAQQAGPQLATLVESNLTYARTLDRGNANPSNIGKDFGRFGFELWTRVRNRHVHNERRRERLEQVCTWRNAIVHQDFNLSAEQQNLLSDTTIDLGWCRRWRRALGALTQEMDTVVGNELLAVAGVNPW